MPDGDDRKIFTGKFRMPGFTAQALVVPMLQNKIHGPQMYFRHNYRLIYVQIWDQSPRFTESMQ